MYLMMTKACTDTDCEFISSCTVQVSLAVLIKNIKYMNPLKLTGGELRNGVNGFLTSYATDSVRFSQQILDI